MKSTCLTPLSVRYLAAGELLAILPAGEIWSVVIESPKLQRTYALLMFFNLGNCKSVDWKNGGLWM